MLPNLFNDYAIISCYIMEEVYTAFKFTSQI